MGQKITKVCKHCNSENVYLTDVILEWDNFWQDWVEDILSDKGYCKDCDGETTIIDKLLENG